MQPALVSTGGFRVWGLGFRGGLLKRKLIVCLLIYRCYAGERKCHPTVDGRNPFRTSLKPMETIVCWYLRRESSFQGFLGGAGFRPSTVSWLRLASESLKKGETRPKAQKVERVLWLQLGGLDRWFGGGFPCSLKNHSFNSKSKPIQTQPNQGWPDLRFFGKRQPPHATNNAWAPKTPKTEVGIEAPINLCFKGSPCQEPCQRGCGSKLSHQTTAGLSLWLHLPEQAILGLPRFSPTATCQDSFEWKWTGFGR